MRQRLPGELRLRVGVDAVGVERVRAVLSSDGHRSRRVFTQRELDHCSGRRRRDEQLAARFAAKEAVLKAFGTGITRGMRLTDVEVVNEPGGRPTIVLDGAAARFAAERGLRQLEVSLSHTRDLAMATVISSWEQ